MRMQMCFVYISEGMCVFLVSKQIKNWTELQKSQKKNH